ncbi:tRNA-dihydrouridine synthase C [Clavibacter michiganensis subsp. michiganensis]|uniref:tRNA-dihydrouridine synthase C n=1 Tax=Clavibacter michiganensis subsp. michiganensis TaxID=33013 RepID=A0A251XCW9_CLAMM|nr:tRNA-dihydrouridine synthase C [Clavibacter michiganensis subsp. michiganensis]OUD99866.1 tRNA-dihydrouridine synthase C [Clavibacter michiganensis subsp. michiganensis]
MSSPTLVPVPSAADAPGAPATAPAAEPALRIGGIPLDEPVVLAPMAGITNTAFRRLCREFGAGLYVSEMITSRALVERTPESMRLITHHPSEKVRSIQLYGVDPKTVREAVTMLVAEDRADHIDLNFGCPVAKVTRKGGGAALPWKLGLFTDIVEGAVKAAGDIPLTVKMRKGIDADHLTYLDAGRAAEGAGVASIALHARTAADYYSGHADWSAIAKLKQAIESVPVLGNGDIWAAEDAIRMMDETGADGSSSAAAASAARGSSATWPPRSTRAPPASIPQTRPARTRPRARSPTRSAATSSSSPSSSRARSGAAATRASTSPGTSRGTPSAATCGPRSPRRPRSRRSTACSPRSTATSPTRAPAPRARAAARAA